MNTPRYRTLYFDASVDGELGAYLSANVSNTEEIREVLFDNRFYSGHYDSVRAVIIIESPTPL